MPTIYQGVRMHASSWLVLLASLVTPPLAWAGKTYDILMNVGGNDTFQVTETDQWNVKVEKYLPMRFADVRIDEKNGYPFSLMLYFKCDTPDLAHFDSPEKIEKSVRVSSEKYLPGTVEKVVTLRKAPVSTYGYYTVLTDAATVKKDTTERGEFKYITRGMIRLSQYSALGFSLMTNDENSSEYDNLLKYVYSFSKSER